MVTDDAGGAADVYSDPLPHADDTQQIKQIVKARPSMRISVTTSVRAGGSGGGSAVLVVD
jgi:hypothetical protein